MARKAARSTEVYPYILQADRVLPEHEQSVFHLRPLTQVERMAILDDGSWIRIEPDGSRVLVSRSFTQARQLVLSHLERVERFPVEAPQAWPKDGLPRDREKYLEMLSELDIWEIGNEIRSHVVLDGAAVTATT